jgi:hypothetical protein
MRRTRAFLLSVLLVAIGVGLDRLWIMLQRRAAGMRYLALAQELMSPTDEWRKDATVAKYLPRALRSSHDAAVWLLLRAKDEYEPLGRTVDTFLGGLLVFEDCDTARYYLERAAGDATARRVLDNLRDEGCRRALESRLEATREAMKSGAIPTNEMSVELLALGERQLDRLGKAELSTTTSE